ncbi:hypothetical protein TMatcc_003472 [Talaromyces marneffei ATCC 18224]
MGGGCYGDFRRVCLVKILIDQSVPTSDDRIVSLVLWHAKIILLHTTLYNCMRIGYRPVVKPIYREQPFQDSITNPCGSTKFMESIMQTCCLGTSATIG